MEKRVRVSQSAGMDAPDGMTALNLIEQSLDALLETRTVMVNLDNALTAHMEECDEPDHISHAVELMFGMQAIDRMITDWVDTQPDREAAVEAINDRAVQIGMRISGQDEAVIRQAIADGQQQQAMNDLLTEVIHDQFGTNPDA